MPNSPLLMVKVGRCVGRQSTVQLIATFRTSLMALTARLRYRRVAVSRRRNVPTALPKGVTMVIRSWGKRAVTAPTMLRTTLTVAADSPLPVTLPAPTITVLRLPASSGRRVSVKPRSARSMECSPPPQNTFATRVVVGASWKAAITSHVAIAVVRVKAARLPIRRRTPYVPHSGPPTPITGGSRTGLFMTRYSIVSRPKVMTAARKVREVLLTMSRLQCGGGILCAGSHVRDSIQHAV